MSSSFNGKIYIIEWDRQPRNYYKDLYYLEMAYTVSLLLISSSTTGVPNLWVMRGLQPGRGNGRRTCILTCARAGECTHPPFAWVAGVRACHLCKWNCICTLAGCTRRTIPSPSSRRSAKPETMGNSAVQVTWPHYSTSLQCHWTGCYQLKGGISILIINTRKRRWHRYIVKIDFFFQISNLKIYKQEKNYSELFLLS